MALPGRVGHTSRVGGVADDPDVGAALTQPGDQVVARAARRHQHDGGEIVGDPHRPGVHIVEGGLVIPDLTKPGVRREADLEGGQAAQLVAPLVS